MKSNMQRNEIRIKKTTIDYEHIEHLRNSTSNEIKTSSIVQSDNRSHNEIKLRTTVKFLDRPMFEIR